jgi:hypothetical protein
MPPGLVASKTTFDKNPRLETVVGFFVTTPSGHNTTAMKSRMKIAIKAGRASRRAS